MTGLRVKRSCARKWYRRTSVSLVIVGILTAGLAAGSARAATYTIVPSEATINPGGAVTIDIYVEDLDGAPLVGYSGWMEVTGGNTGEVTIEVTQCTVDTARNDWVFAAGTSGLAFGQWHASLPIFFGVTGTECDIYGQGYLASATLKASADALGTFEVGFTDINGGYTNLEGPSTGGPDFTTYQIDQINTLTVNVVEPMPNDDCADIMLLGDGRTRFDMLNATLDGPTLYCDGAPMTPDIWYEYHASHTGVLTISTCGDANFDTILAVYGQDSSVCECPTTNDDLLLCNDNSTGCGHQTSEVVLAGVAGNCYTVRLGGARTAEGTGYITVTCIGNDSCGNAEIITSLPATIGGSTLNTAVDDDTGQPVCGRAIDSPGVWYTVQGTGRLMTASLCLGASYNTAISVYEGSCGDLTCVAGNDNFCGSQASASWCSVSGRPYRILVHGANGEHGAFTLSVTDDDCDDTNACTTDYCSDGACVNEDTTPGDQCCTPGTGNYTVIDDGNPCTNDVCLASGAVTHNPGPNGINTACEDGFTCTLDECLAGECVHPPIAGRPCIGDGDCYGGTCTGLGSTCECIERPTLYLVPRPSAQVNDTCYAVGEQLVVDLVLEEGPSPIVGGQFFLEYDPMVLDFVSIEPGEEPFTFQVFESVDEFAGTIDYSVMVAFGENGTALEATLATVTFDVLDECTPYVAFRSHTPPTYLSAQGGSAVHPIYGELPPITSDGFVPVIAACPAGVVGYPDPGEFTAVVTWPQPAPATDSCDGSVAITCNPPSGYAFPVGTTTVTCSAEDDCGGVGTCTFDVEVQPMTLTVDVELSPVIAGAEFDRCISFDLCDIDGGLYETVSQTMHFTRSGTGAIAQDVLVEIPGGGWDCVTARDPLHTLSSQAIDLTVAGNGLDYSATFVGDRSLGGHWLLMGNLNGDHYVDILDLGVFLGQYMQPTIVDTPCGTGAPHADLNADGFIHLADFAVLQLNLFQAGEPLCECAQGGVAGGSPGPLRSIPVSELRAKGLSILESADENHDGIVEIHEATNLIRNRMQNRAIRDGARPSIHRGQKVKVAQPKRADEKP